MEKKLLDCLSVTSQIHPVKDREGWRITLKFVAEGPAGGIVVLGSGEVAYWIFASWEYLEDKAKIKPDSKEEVQKFALDFISSRFDEVGKDAEKIKETGWIFTNERAGALRENRNLLTGVYLETRKIG